MRKHSNIRSALSLLLTFIMIFSQSGVTTLAREIETDSFPDVSVTEEAIDIINDADVIAEVQEPDVALNNESGELTMDIVTGDTDALIGEGYANLPVPEIQGTIDLGTSIYDGDVTIALPVEGTNRQYVHTFEYDFTSVNGVKAASFSNDDVEGTVWTDEQGNVSPLSAEDEIFLHYIDSQKTRVYSYDDKSVTVRAEVTDPESIPDNAELVVTPIISGDAYNAYLNALNEQIDGTYNSENTLLYDISFLAPKADSEGNPIDGEYVEIKPAGESVSISMQFKENQLTDELKAAEPEEIQIVHLPLDEALVAAYDTTVDALEGTSGAAHTEQELTEGITAEVVAATTDLQGGGQIEFDAAEFSVYAVTLATAPNFSFDFKVKFIDESGNPAPPESLDGSRYYLVATVKRDLDMGAWTQNGVDFIGYQEIEAGNDTASMTIDSSTIQSFVAAYWGGLHNESTFGNNATPGTVVYCKLVKTDGAGISGNNYTGEMNNGEKIGAYTLRMTGSPDVTLTYPNEIVFEAVLSGYKYSVETYDEDGVTPLGNADLSDQYYVVAHRANDPEKYFVQPLNLSSGSQSGVISTFNYKYYKPQSADYVPGDDVIVEIASSPDMYSNPQQYQIDSATFFPLGSYLEGKFKVEDVNSAEGDRTIIKLVKTPDYNYEVVVKTLQGDLTSGDPSGLNLKVAARSNYIDSNSGYYYASDNLSLSGDTGTTPWFDDSEIVIINSDQSELADIVQSGEIYGDGSVVGERYTMSVSVDDDAKLVTITLTELPKYFARTSIIKQNEETSLDTSKYYVLSTMENSDGTTSTYLQKWDDIPAEGYQVGETTTALSDNPESYTTEKTVNVRLLKADGELSLGEDGVVGDYQELTEGQMTNGFKVSYTEEKPDQDDHSTTVTLTELNPGQDYPVDIKFVDYYDEPVSPGLGDNYYLLAYLKPANGPDDVVAWSLKQINWDDSATTTVIFENGAFNVCDSAGESAGDTIGFNPDDFIISTRIYRAPEGTELTDYNDAREHGIDYVEGFDFVSNKQETDGDDNPVKSVITLKKATDKKYKVNVEGTDKLANTGKNYYVFLKAVHSSTADSFVLSDAIDLGGSYTGVIDNDAWVLENGEAADPFTGNETLSYYIVEADSEPAITDVIAVLNGGENDGLRIYNENALFKDTAAAKFVFDSRERIEDIRDTDITDKLIIKDSTATNDYDVKAIMGPGLLYGVTAEFFNPNGHLQTNFAVNRLNPCDSTAFGWVHPNLSGEPGTIVAASIDPGTKLRIEEDHSLSTIPIIVDPSDTGKVVTGMKTVLDPPAFVVEQDSNQISNQIVNPIINHMRTMSEELLAHEDTFEPEIEEWPGTVTALNQTLDITCTELDVTAYPEDATIYIDGERYLKYLAQKEALTIKKYPNQVVVFNFDTATNVDLDTFVVQYKNPDNTWQEPISTQSDWQDTSEDGINRKIDTIAQHIVFNCANADTVQTGGTAGMILVPRDDSTLTIKYESGAGWIVSAGEVTSDNSLLYENGFGDDACFEWHGLYSEMPSSSNASLTLDKLIDGESPTTAEVFNFDVDRFIVENNVLEDLEQNWETIATVKNKGQTVFYSIEEPSGEPIIYRVKEKGAVSTDGSYVQDSTIYYARIKMKEVTETYFIATVQYYDNFADALAGDPDEQLTTEPVFNNKEMPVYGPKISKKLVYKNSRHVVENALWPQGGFVFNITLDTGATDSDLADKVLYRISQGNKVTLDIPVNELDTYIANFDQIISEYNLTNAESNALRNRLNGLGKATANIANNKQASFKDLTFKEAGSYVFNITESVPADASDTDIIYNEEPIALTVVVTEEGGSLVISSVNYTSGETTSAATEASDISDLSFEYVNTYKESGNKLTFAKSVTGGVSEEEAKGALTFTVQNVTTGKYLAVSNSGEESWVDAETELSLGTLAKLDGYTVTGNVDDGYLFKVVLEDIEAGTYTITEKNSAVVGFETKSTSVTTGTKDLSATGTEQINLSDEYEEITTGKLTFTKTV
ncbi:MAG TPA: hypothetical protein DCX23_04390, partial [Lachnospiraceae bacterium]|nr:hypothetical protein [Lachnospiraceae bacterium]